MKNLQESVITAIFSEDRKKILLIKRRDVPVWVLPGGGVECKEFPEVAALREAKEETGYSFKLVKKIGEYTPVNKLTKLTHFYELEIVEGRATTGSETKAVEFFDLKNLPKLIPPPHDEWIQEAIENPSNIIQRPLSSITYSRLIKNFFFHPILVIRFVLTKIGIRMNT